MNNVKPNTIIPKCITLDQNTIRKLEEYAEYHAISVSAAVRVGLNEFFKEGDCLK